MKPYEYYDGSANQYIISSDEITYNPVKPENSSTGMYSGGNPYKKKLNAVQHEYLEKIFINAANSTERLEGIPDNRNKGTGLLILPDGTKHIFSMISSQKHIIEDALRKIEDYR